MAPPRKSVTRGSGYTEDDPERANRTQARTHNPLTVDKERRTGTSSRVAGGSKSPKTQTKQAPDEAQGSYSTGQSYRLPDDDPHGLAGSSISLEGDGLEALDPEIGPQTKSVSAVEAPSDAAEAQEEEPDDNATRAGPPLLVEIVAGPDTGKKKKFKGVRMVIGRTPGVDLLLSDQSVSRRHVELIYGDDGVVMKDLGSGNGTKVNGVKVAEQKLNHGDEIGLGKTRIKFIDERAAFEQARAEEEQRAREEAEAAGAQTQAGAPLEAEASAAPPPEGVADEAAAPDDAEARRAPVRTSRNTPGAGPLARLSALPKGVRVGAAVLVGLVLLAVVGGLLMRPPPPPAVDPSVAQAEQKMQDARAAIREGKFSVAVDLVAEAEELQPGIDKSNLGPQAQAELAFLSALDDARKAVAEHRFDDARAALAKAVKGSIKSEEARTKVRTEMETAEREYKKEKIVELISAGEIEAAKAVLAELPIEQQAESAKQIVEFERQLADQKAMELKEAAAAAHSAQVVQQEHHEQAVSEAFAVVERKFAGAEWDRAASECSRVIDTHSSDADIASRAKKLQGLIPNFGRNYDEGGKKYRQGAKAQAAKPLRQAYTLLEQIGLRANSYREELKEKIGDAALVAGREALVRDDLVTAFQMFKDVTHFSPEDPKGRSGLEDVAGRAELLFEDAYLGRDQDPRNSLRKFKVVVQVTEPGSTVHEKAKNQIAAMSN